jgi:16S rRNA U516 pseudouridylate synthase RsuA-like enzyme
MKVCFFFAISNQIHFKHTLRRTCNPFKTFHSNVNPISSSLVGQCNPPEIASGVRVNRCILSLSRRAADAAIENGRVTINGVKASSGNRCHHGDIVCFDGKIQNWESVAEARDSFPVASSSSDNSFLYLKYWKPTGVTCTSDISDRSNLIQYAGFDALPERVFTVGRLDKMSTGLVLLTSDGRLADTLLKPQNEHAKVIGWRN